VNDVFVWHRVEINTKCHIDQAVVRQMVGVCLLKSRLKVPRLMRNFLLKYVPPDGTLGLS